MLSERNARPAMNTPPTHTPPPPPPNLTMRSSARKAVPLAGAALAPNPYPSCLHR